MPPMSRAGRRALIAGTAVAILVTGSAALAGMWRRAAAQRWVEHTYAVLGSLDHAVAGRVDAETGQRGYLLTGREAYLRPYRQGLRAHDEALHQLRSLTADNGIQQRRLDTLAVLSGRKRAELAGTIATRDSLGPAAAAVIVETERGRETMDSVRRVALTLERAERDLLTGREEIETRGQRLVLLLAGLATAGGVVLVLVQGGLLSRAVSDQERLSAELAERARQLEESAAELEMSNEELQSTNEQMQHTVEELRTTAEELETANEELQVANDDISRSRDDLASRQADLARSEARFRSLVSASAQAVWWTDPAGLVGGPLPAWQAFVGRPAAEIQGRGWMQDIHPDDRERTTGRWRQALESGSPYEITHRVRRHDGEWRTMAVHGVPVLAADGRIVEWIGANVDVTEQDQAASALRASEALFRTLADHLPVSLLVCRPDGETTYVNPAWTALTGRSAAQARVGGWSSAVHPEDRARVRREWSAALAGGRAELDFRYERPDSSARHVRATSAAVHDAAGAVTVVLCLGVDLSERFDVEEQLRHAQRMQAVGRLAGGMAHELNNMLTASIGFSVYALRSLVADHQAVRDIRESLKAQERAARITSQVLSFSRRQMLAPTRFEVNQAVHDLKPLLQQSLDPGRTLRLDLASDAGAVQADRTRLDQALLNVALNARDAMPDGGALTLSTRCVTISSGTLAGPEGESLPAGQYVVLTLADTGHGMDPATRRRAIEPFFTTKPQGVGTGLGLSMAYGFVRQSGGTLTIESEGGRGTTVHLYLPLSAAEVGLDPAVSPAPGLRSPSGEHVLVVDDEPSVRATMRRSLEEQGYRVVEAASGPDALARLGETAGAVHLVVCDLVMPDMSGEALGAAIRERWPALPVLYVSGFPDAEAAAERMLPVGAPFLKKPFSPDVLAARVRAVLEAL